MKSRFLMMTVVLTTAFCGLVPSFGEDIFPVAIFPFQERGRGVREYGAKVSEILFASLVVNPDLYLVDRSEMKKTLEEAELNLSGMVRSDQATQIGQLTGAKILVTGSVIEVDKTLYLVAKIIGTETSRVFGQSVKGGVNDELDVLVEQLGEKVGQTIKERGNQLVAKTVKREERIKALRDQLGEARRPTVLVEVSERHVGRVTIDPAAETELILFCRETGFDVIDAKVGSQKQADILIKGEGFSEFATRRGNLISVKARLEVKAIDRKTDKIIATDRQTEVIVDLTEQIAGKTALQKAAAIIAARLLPALVVKK